MRKKKREPIIHKPSIHEVFYCLEEMPAWVRLLLPESRQKQYRDFLPWLADNYLNKKREEKLNVKKLSSEFGITPTKATQWIFSIYEDLYTLNQEKPDLFWGNGHAVTLYMKHYDNYATFYLSLPIIPREFETVTFNFIKAKVGTDRFWVKEIEHVLLNDKLEIMVTLNSGFVNKFREYALDKAEFQGWIPLLDRYNKYDFEIDKELKELYPK